MSMVTVWRMEDESHNGPYQIDDPEINSAFDEMYEWHSISIDNLSPSFDFRLSDIGLWHGNWVYGFPSKEAAEKWFEGYLNLLDNYGYKLNAYTVPSENVLIGFSKTQLVFAPPWIFAEKVA